MSKKYIVKNESITTYKYEKGTYSTQIQTIEHFEDSKKAALELINLLVDDYERLLASDGRIMVRVCDDEDLKIIMGREITSYVDRIYEHRLVVLER